MPMTTDAMLKIRTLVLDGMCWKCLSLLHNLVAILASETVPETGSRPCPSAAIFLTSFPQLRTPKHTSCRRSTGSIPCPHPPWSFASSPRAALWKHAHPQPIPCNSWRELFLESPSFSGIRLTPTHIWLCSKTHRLWLKFRRIMIGV